MNIQFIAQSWFIIESNNKRIAIDLWTSNPVYPLQHEEVPHIDYFFLTHDHSDHGMQDMIALAKRDEACFVTTVELAKKVAEQWVTQVESCAPWGEFKLDESVSVFVTEAVHTSQTGFPCGYIIRFDDKVIYHAGDTAYMESFKFYSALYSIDVAMIPIGSRYTMWPREAVYAVRDLRPKVTIPIHYNLSAKTKQDPDVFIQGLQEKHIETDVRVMQWGQHIQV